LSATEFIAMASECIVYMYSTSPARQSAAPRRSDQLFLACSLIDASCQEDENILPESTRSSQASHRARRNVSCCDRIGEASSLRSKGRRTGRTASAVSGRRLCAKTRSLDWSATLMLCATYRAYGLTAGRVACGRSDPGSRALPLRGR